MKEKLKINQTINEEPKVEIKANFKKITSVPFIENPRHITDRGLKELRESLERYGDLSGVVININTGERITGNQRCKILDVNECEIEIIKDFGSPDAQGTVRIGLINWNGFYYTYREVDWSEEDAKIANIAANKMGGTFDENMMKKISIDILKKGGYSDNEIEKLKVGERMKITDTTAEYDIVPKLSEKYSYVLIIAENEIDLAWLDTFFEIQLVKSYKNDNVGIGRVIRFEKFKSLIDKLNTNGNS